MNNFQNQQQMNFNNQQQPPTNQYTQARPLNTSVNNPELEYIHREQRNSVIAHLVSLLLVFIASMVIHTYAILVVFGAVAIWIGTAIGVYLMPNEERQNIRKTKVWVIGYTSIAIVFDMILSNLLTNPSGYGLDGAVTHFLSIMRIMIFLGTPIMYIGILAKRIHFNWEVRNNEEKTAAYMRQNTKKLF